MQRMEVLRVKIFQPKACYATPLSFKGIETYPLPPYSTIRGMIYNAIGRKYKEGDEIEFSIQGRYESVYRDYWNAVKFGDEGKSKKPIEVPTLHNLKLIIHIKGNIIDEIEKSLKKPSVYLSLGRYEDLIIVDECQRVTLEEINLDDNLFEKPMVSLYSAYIPFEKAKESGLRGIFYRLNYFYEIKNDYRIFVNTKDVYYVDEPYVIEKGKILADIDKNKEDGEVYPVWF